MVGGEPVLYLERGGRALRVLAGTGTDWGDTRSARIPKSASAAGECLPASVEDPEDSRTQQALLALAEHARSGRLPARIALERVDGEPVLGSPWEAVLVRAGFRAGPRRVELAATPSGR